MRAAIDLGSSSVKMLVVDEDGRVVDDRRIGTNLGKGLPADGSLPEANQSRTLEGLRALLSSTEIAPSAIPVIATAAVRNAPNGEAFMARVRREVGLSLARTLSGDEEAQLGYRAATTPLRRMGPGRFATLDLGGGSFQLAMGDEKSMEAGGSTQCGSNWITANFSEDFAAADHALVARAPLPLSVEQLRGRRWAAVGGIALFLRAHVGSDVIARGQIEALRAKLGTQSVDERGAYLTQGQSPAQRRALGTDTREGLLDSAQKIPAKLTLLLHIMRSAGLDELHVSDTDARHVLVEELLSRPSASSCSR